jgi:hypothetical protein
MFASCWWWGDDLGPLLREPLLGRLPMFWGDEDVIDRDDRDVLEHVGDAEG